MVQNSQGAGAEGEEGAHGRQGLIGPQSAECPWEWPSVDCAGIARIAAGCCYHVRGGAAHAAARLRKRLLSVETREGAGI
eukprot:364649-Rhodomonas_salina.1